MNTYTKGHRQPTTHRTESFLTTSRRLTAYRDSLIHLPAALVMAFLAFLLRWFARRLLTGKGNRVKGRAGAWVHVMG